MKKLLLPFLLACCIGVQAQEVKQWLSLTPVGVKQPALSEVKNVKDKTFGETMLLEYSGLDVRRMSPADGRTEGSLQWGTASLEQDTVTAAQTGGAWSLNYYATYLENPDWISGKLTFRLFGVAEIYVDGVKKATASRAEASTQTVPVEWIPGKHLIVVKALTQGGKAVFARFDADEAFAGEPVVFSVSPKRGKRIDDVLNGMRITRLDLSHSGKYALVGKSNIVEGKATSNTYIYNVATQEIAYMFAGNTVSALQWMPGQDAVTYLQNEGGSRSLYAYDVESGHQGCLIREDAKIHNYTWSPDGTYLIYTDTEKYDDPKWELRKLNGVQDRQAYFRNRTFLCKYDLATGLHSRLTWGNLSTSLQDISRDGKQLIFSTSRPVYGEFPFSKQNIYLLDMETLQIDTLWKDRTISVSCQFSPDGKKLLVQGGASAFGTLGEKVAKGQIPNQYDTQLFIYDLASRKAQAITRDFNPSVEEAVWHEDGNIYAKVTDADFVRLYRYRNGKFSRIDCPGDMILQTTWAQHAPAMMYTASTVHYPAQVYTLDLTDDKAILWDNPCQKQFRDVEFGEMKDWDYNYKKGTLIDGRYYLPANFDSSKKYPLIVYYYGGTTPVSRTFGGRWPFNLYTANGYVVYVLQPSGAIGYGQEFSARHQNNWCKITADEIIASVKAFAKAHPFIDASRIGCMGASYGGFTTEYLTTQTDLFACAISHAGISSISSYWGEGYWGYGYSINASAHSYPWNRKDIYVDQSPLFNADKVQVPILLIHGTADVNVPTGESIQFYTALKLLGKDAELVLVKDADHAVVDYQQRILWNNTILSYFAKYLKGKPAWWEHQYKDLNL